MTKEQLWDMITKLGLQHSVKKCIDLANQDLLEAGYTSYSMEYLYSALAEGVEHAGADKLIEFADGEILAQAYLTGYLLGKHAVKNQS